MSAVVHASLSEFLWPEQSGAFVRAITLVAVGTLLLAASAQLQIPMIPVPLTLQTLVVFLLGAAYGPRLGAATVATYLIAGAGGLPVFAGGASAAALVGPTAGYLLGFVVAAALVGRCAAAGWDRTPWKMAGAMLLGNAVIFLCGATWLAQFVGWSQSFALGVVPFIPGDILKIAAAMWLLPRAWHTLQS